MNKQELISMYERISNFSENASTKKVIANLRKLDEPQACHADVTPRYLRNVIARLRELPLHDREVWLKAIMDEFEEDFSHSKWREGYEQGKSEGAWVGQQLKDADKIRRELNRPIVPQFVAEIIEYYKRNNATLYDALREKNFNKQYSEWLLNEQNAYDKVAKAWLDGYEVEKEKRYTVKIKTYLGQFLGRYYLNDEELTPQFTRSQLTGKGELPTFTRQELEETGFGWIFSCEGIEVEEEEE